MELEYIQYKHYRYLFKHYVVLCILDNTYHTIESVRIRESLTATAAATHGYTY